jgi:hypothetical protein
MTTEGQQLATAAGSADPAVGLRAVRALRELAERLEAGHVAKAREKGWSWQDIADCIGVSRQAVHQKYGKLEAANVSNSNGTNGDGTNSKGTNSKGTSGGRTGPRRLLGKGR